MIFSKFSNKVKIKTKNGSTENPLTRKLGPSIRFCHVNVESISYTNSEYLSKILKPDTIDLIAIQETYCDSEQQLQKRGKIPGYELLGARHHRSYGVKTYVKQNIDNATLIFIQGHSQHDSKNR